MKNTNKKGFTLVELVIVIAVIAILAAVLIPTFTSVINRAKQSAALQAARSAFEEFLIDLDYTKNDDVEKSTNSYVIVQDGYYFAVKDGQFLATINTTEGAAIAATEETVASDGNTLKNVGFTTPTAGNYFVQIAQNSNFYALTAVAATVTP